MNIATVISEVGSMILLLLATKDLFAGGMKKPVYILISFWLVSTIIAGVT